MRFSTFLVHAIAAVTVTASVSLLSLALRAGEKNTTNSSPAPKWGTVPNNLLSQLKKGSSHKEYVSTTPGPHRIVVIPWDNGPDWTNQMPEEWCPRSVNEIELRARVQEEK